MDSMICVAWWWLRPGGSECELWIAFLCLPCSLLSSQSRPRGQLLKQCLFADNGRTSFSERDRKNITWYAVRRIIVCLLRWRIRFQKSVFACALSHPLPYMFGLVLRVQVESSSCSLVAAASWVLLLPEVFFLLWCLNCSHDINSLRHRKHVV